MVSGSFLDLMTSNQYGKTNSIPDTSWQQNDVLHVKPIQINMNMSNKR